jgi:pyruvate formate lyase activating enzyme
MRIGGFEKNTLIDFPGKIACILYTIGCNFRCPYCHNPELVDETASEIPLESIWNFLEQRKGLIDGVVITGGEPTLHEDLPDFIRKIKEMGYLVKLDSNGTRPGVLKVLIQEKLVDYIAMDIKSPLEMYTYTVGRPVLPETLRTSIELIKNSGIRYEFRTTVVKALLKPEDIEQIGKEIKGASTYYLQKFSSSKILNPQFRNKVTYSDEEFWKLKRMMEQYVGYCGIR